jgi:hypothetical protein
VQRQSKNDIDDPLHRLTRTGAPDPMVLAGALANASSAVARLDQALTGHPLASAVLYRARLEAVRRQAGVDGQLIDPWHLAATLEGLRLRMDPQLRIIDRGAILDKARAALALHQWIAEPDFDQEGEVQRAEAMLASQPASLPPLIGAAQGFRAWINAGETRPAMRAAMIRYWRKRHLLRLPVPLTGAASLRPEQSWDWDLWAPAFLSAIETEASDALDLLYILERAWFSARRATAERRKDAHDAQAVDVLAAAPVLSATTLARVLGIAVKNAIRILDTLVAAEVAIEVTHRSKRRLFALSGLVPIRDAVRPPYRAEPGRGRGRPRHEIEQAVTDTALPPLPPLTPMERRSFDYTALEEAMSQLDAVVRRSRHALTPRGPMMLEAPAKRPDEPIGAGGDSLEETSGRRAESKESRFAAE